MAVYKTKTGKWQAVVSYRDDFGNPKKKKKSFDLKREAEEFEDTFLKSLNSIVNDSITFSKVFEEYIKQVEINSNANSVAEKRRITKNFFEDLSSKKMDKISKKNYFDVYHKIATSDYSYLYKRKIITQLKSIANFAYIFYNIADNTKTLPSLKKKVSDHIEMNIWSEKEFKQFISKVENEVMATFFHTLFYTGLRRGEALAILKSDLRSKSLSVTKSIKHFKNGFLPLKTASSNRIVSLDDVTYKKIKHLKDNLEGDFIFGGLEPFGITTIQREFVKGIETSGVRKIRIHDLRHSHASLLINKGANIVAVSKRLGHSNTKTTLEVYTHLMKESEAKLLKLLNE